MIFVDLDVQFIRLVRKTAESDFSLHHFCPSVRMEQLSSRWTDVRENLYLNIFRQIAEKIQVSLKSDKKKGHFT